MAKSKQYGRKHLIEFIDFRATTYEEKHLREKLEDAKHIAVKTKEITEDVLVAEG